jgi:hypothetical protein
MKALLFRRDASMRFVGRWMFVGPAFTVAILGVVAGARLAGGVGPEKSLVDVALTLLAIWLPTAAYLGVASGERRCSRFDMGLPVSSSDLWVAHGLAMACSGLAVLAVTACATWALGCVAGHWVYEIPVAFSQGVVPLALRVAAVSLLSVAISQSVSPSLERIPRGRTLVWSTIGLIGALFGLIVVLALLPLAVSLVPLAAAGALGWRTLRGLAGTVVVVPLEPTAPCGEGKRGVAQAPSRGQASDWGAVRRRGRAGRAWLLVMTIYRSMTKKLLAPVIAVPILVIAGYTMSGAFGGAIRSDDTIRFSLLFITSYAMLAFSGLPPRRLYFFDPIPVSRRFIFAIIYLHLVLLLGLGYGVGRIVADRAESGRELISYVERDDHYYVSVPLHNGGIALDGSSPLATSAWGESHEVWSREVWSGRSRVVYSKFSTPHGSSREFVALQISRAVKDIYGEEISPEEVSARYLAVDAAGRVVPAGSELTLRGDHPEWRVLSHGPVFPVMMLVVCGMWLLALSAYLGTLRPGFTEKQRKGIFWWGMVILMGLHFLQFVLLFTGTLDHWILSGFWMIVIGELTERLPGGAVSVWFLCGLILFLLYRMAERRFIRVESVPGDDIRVSLIGRPIGASIEDGAYAR